MSKEQTIGRDGEILEDAILSDLRRSVFANKEYIYFLSDLCASFVDYYGLEAEVVLKKLLDKLVGEKYCKEHKHMKFGFCYVRDNS